MRRLEAIGARIAPVLPALVVGLAAAFALRRLDNTDTWWHLAAGRWIAEHGAVPHTDTLSFTVPDHAWTDLQWLFEVIFYALHRVGGPTLLVIASATTYALATAVLLTNLRRVLGGVGAAALAIWAVGVAEERFAIRPEMVSFLLIEVVLWLCATGRGTNDRRLWLLPAVMSVWVNSHALFILGAFVIACYMAGTLAARMWLAGGAALAATLVNPYGLEGAAFPVKLMSRINGSNPVFQSIGELRRPFSGYFVTFAVTAYQLFFVFALVVTALAVALSIRRPKRRDRRDVHLDVPGLAVFVGLALLSLLARRNMGIFAFGAAPFVAQCIAVVRLQLPDAARRTADHATAALALAMPAAVAVAGWFVVTNGFYRWNSELHEFGTGVLAVMFPIRATGFARAMKLPPPLFNDFTSGGYLAWERPLDTGVYIDGRTEVYDVDFFSRYSADLANPPRWQADVDARGIQTVVFFHWWPNHRPLLHHLTTDWRWAVVYFDEVALVCVRRAGNEELITRAEAASRPIRQQLAEELLGPVSSWQWPVARLRALSTYATVLDLMGRADEAAPFYSRLVELGPPPGEAAGVQLRLAQYHASRGETGVARMYLRGAAAADSTHPGIAQLAARLGR